MTSTSLKQGHLFFALLGLLAIVAAVIVGFAVSSEPRTSHLDTHIAPAAETQVGVAPGLELPAPPDEVPGPAADAGPTSLAGLIPEPWELAEVAAGADAPAEAAVALAADAPPAVPPVVVAPAAPTPTPAVTAASPPMSPPTSEAAAPALAKAPLVAIVDAAIATNVADRTPEGVADVFGDDAETIWAWVKVENAGPRTTVTMEWRKDGEVGSRMTLNVGTSSGWRTWSRKTVRSWDVGEWTVDVRDANGTLVKSLDFEIAPGGVRADG